jgi:hypothetical protein
MSAEQESKGGSDCDPKDVQGFECDGERYKKQHEVSQGAEAKLKEFKTQYDTARALYIKAADEADAKLTTIGQKLKNVEDLVSCHIDEDLQECFKSKVKEVLKEVAQCDTVATGCCTTELPPEGPAAESEQQYQQEEEEAKKPQSTVLDLAAQIAEWRRVTQLNTDCYTRLGSEAAEIAKRVTTLDADVTKLAADVNLEGRDWKRLYVRWYIAWLQSQPKTIKGGFDSVDKYMDCLCRTLVAIGQGWRKIIVLEGDKAYLECIEKSKKAECELKKKNIVDEVVGRCANCKNGDSEGDPSSDPDCGCSEHTKESEVA